MSSRDLDKLKPGVRLRIKRGYLNAGQIVEFVRFPIRGDHMRVEVKVDGESETMITSVNKFTLIKD